MGKWMNERFKEGSVGTVAKAMNDFLNTLNGFQGASAKTVMCNQANKDPFGGVFYYDGDYAETPVQAGSWSDSTLKNSNSQVLFDETTEILNGLPLQDALATNLSLSNKDGAAPTMSIFQPASVISA